MRGELLLSKFNTVYIGSQRLDGYHIENYSWDKEDVCKQCGNPFIKKYKKQIFCSRKCVAQYKTRIKEAKKQEGFLDWLKEEIDYSYSPEKF